jgi:hypothetical protein
LAEEPSKKPVTLSLNDGLLGGGAADEAGAGAEAVDEPPSDPSPPEQPEASSASESSVATDRQSLNRIGLWFCRIPPTRCLA